ncbi:MAG: methylmalonyl Co-A mutase-associated GTPase MeaB [Planctomycetota bacterium]
MGTIDDLVAGVLRSDRGALARSITQIESRLEPEAEQREQLLAGVLPHAGKALRIGITGAPGVGKSTLIERLGLRLCQAGHKVAVLAVDPSSTVTGGSILGDKTRMDELSRHENAFVRPSPGGGTLGGVASRTQEAMLLCEAAGHDIILVETIGTGQSEVAVAGMVDFFLLLLSPAAGDELQGIKRGVMELANGVLVHKADGDLAPAANRTAQQCLLALRVLRGDGMPPAPVVVGSSVTGLGIDELWQAIETTIASDRASGSFDTRRRDQAVQWLMRIVREGVLDQVLGRETVAAGLAAARERVASGELLAPAAARELLREAGL